MSRPDAERVWLAFAQHAITGLASQMVTVDPSATSWAQVNRGIADDAAELADEMLERWRIRYCEAELVKVAAPREPAAPSTPVVPAVRDDAVDW
jgi:dihydrodipicolinate synthase/N-acetylneuraminate lyase